jgi:UMF1 family MFS transporter
LVTFALLREHSPPKPNAPVVSVMQSLRGLRQTLREALPYQDFTRLLACAVAYQGGVAVAITLAAIYAEQVIGFQPQETMVLIFVLNLAAFAGALLLGYVQDRIGHKLTLSLTLVGWVATCFIAALSTDKAMFWWAAGIAGFCMGSSQSSGRAMAGLMVPPQRLGEFFGLWTFAIRLASILGPLTYGLITWLSDGNQRLAIGSTSLLFILGLVLLMPVNVERGRLAAQSNP